MKIYYLFAPIEEGCVGPESGVERKVRSQAETMDADLVILPTVKYSGKTSEKIYRRLPLTPGWRNWKYNGEFDDADAVYIRKVYEDSTFIRYLCDIKKSNPSVKIIYEVPTYPENEGSGRGSITGMPYRIKMRRAIKNLSKYVDRIVTFYGQNEIYGIPCIKLINGYDFSKVQLCERSKANEIHILSVAQNASWHGYDRAIEGLHQYYANGGTENFIYNLVGDPLKEYIDKVEEYNLSEHVILHGRKSGEELNDMYRQSFIGLDVLGGHRKDYPVSSSLKSREYGAWGMPLITSSPVDYLDENSEYQLIVPYDDTPLDFETVSEYYHKLFDGNDCNALAQEIRANAEQCCDMKIAMEPVVEWIEGDCE